MRVRLHRSHRLGLPGVMAKGTSPFWIGGNYGIGQYPVAHWPMIAYDKRASDVFTYFAASVIQMRDEKE